MYSHFAFLNLFFTLIYWGGVGACMPQCTPRDQETACRNQFSPSTCFPGRVRPGTSTLPHLPSPHLHFEVAFSVVRPMEARPPSQASGLGSSLPFAHLSVCASLPQPHKALWCVDTKHSVQIKTQITLAQILSPPLLRFAFFCAPFI